MIGTVIRQARQDRGLTLEELAPVIGVSINTLGSWERGDSAMGVFMLQTVALALDTCFEVGAGGVTRGHPSSRGASFGRALASARAWRGLDQIKLADRSGYGKQLISLWELGKNSPRVFRVRDIAQTLDVVFTAGPLGWDWREA